MAAPWRGPSAALLALAMAAPACFHARPMDGTIERHLVVGGATRTYLLHTGGPAKPGRPLVLVLHGWHGSAAGLERRTKGSFDKLADRDGAVVVYPQALGDPQWNAWSDTPPDDVGFLVALVDALAAELGVDRRQVFAAGFSNGAGMAYRLACQRPDLVAAVAPVAGGMSAPVACACHPALPVAIIAMHGTDDSTVPFSSAQRNDIQTWVRRDGCPAQPTSIDVPDVDPLDGTRTRADVFGPCAAGTAVAFYTIEGGGHDWPGGEAVTRLFKHGSTPRDFDAAAVIWDFFRKNARR